MANFTNINDGRTCIRGLYCTCNGNIPSDWVYKPYPNRTCYNSPDNQAERESESSEHMSTNVKDLRWPHLQHQSMNVIIDKFKSMYTSDVLNKDVDANFKAPDSINAKESAGGDPSVNCDPDNNRVLTNGNGIRTPNLQEKKSPEPDYHDSLDSIHCSVCSKPIFMYTKIDFKLFDNWLDSALQLKLHDSHLRDAHSKSTKIASFSDSKYDLNTDNLNGSKHSTNPVVNCKCLQDDTSASCPQSSRDDVGSIVDVASSLLMSSEQAMFTIVENISPGKNCTNEKNLLFESLKRFLQYCLGEDTAIHLTGSTAYDIDIDYSDITSAPSYSDLDIVLLSKRYGGDPRTILQKVYCELTNMQQTLRERNASSVWILGDSNIKLVESAKVPIVIIETKRGLFCDISVNTLYPLLHTELFKNYIGEHSVLRPLMRIIKHWLILRGIPSMKEGGFPSILWMSLFCNAIDTFDYDSKNKSDSDKNEAHTSNTVSYEITSLWKLLQNRTQIKEHDNPENTSKRNPGVGFNILSSLEKCFQKLSDGTHVMDVVNSFSRIKSGTYLAENMNNFCRSLIKLIEMEPNVPHGTWLVYYYELNRAKEYILLYTKRLELLITLLACLRCLSVCHVDELNDECQLFKKIIANVKQLFGYDISHLSQNSMNIAQSLNKFIEKVSSMLRLKLESTELSDKIKLIVYHLFQQFKSIPFEIFEKVHGNIYSIPVAIEPPVPLHISAEPGSEKPQYIDVLIQNIKPQNGRSFDDVLWDDSGWYLVFLQGQLTIVKVVKTCIEWESWWSKEFVSRRDNRSVFHGFIYRQLRLDYDVKRQQNLIFCRGSETIYPSIIVKRGSLVLFNPSDLVSKLHVLKVVKDEPNVSQSLYSNDFYTGARCLYLLPGFEVNRIQYFEDISARIKPNPSADCPHQILFCRICGTVIMKRIHEFVDFKVSQRKLKNAKSTLCSQRYMNIYKYMERHYKRTRQHIITHSNSNYSQSTT